MKHGLKKTEILRIDEDFRKHKFRYAGQCFLATLVV
jgi:hypothetical protein